MPRFSIKFSDSHNQPLRAPKADAYGRRPREVSGVRVAGERDGASLFLTAAAAMAVVAALAMSLALWRLYNFPH